MQKRGRSVYRNDSRNSLEKRSFFGVAVDFSWFIFFVGFFFACIIPLSCCF